MTAHRLRRLFHLRPRGAPEIEADLREEIESHIALGVDHLIGKGVDPATALALTRARFGDFDTTMRTLAASARQREGRMERREWLDMLRQDLGYALRQLRQAPGFTAAVAVTLALGIGANAVMFGIVDRLLLSPPPHVRDADAVVRIQHIRERDGVVAGRYPQTNWPFFQAIADVPGFAAVGAFGFPQSASLGRGADAQGVKLNMATAGFFTALGVRPELGRFFLEEEDRPPTGTAVAVLGYEFWRSALGGDRNVLGRRLAIDGGSYIVVGVAPRGFNGVDLARVDVWIPLTAGMYAMNPDYVSDRGSLMFMTVARLAPGTSPAVVTERATAAYRAVADTRPDAPTKGRIELTSVIAARGQPTNNDARVAAWLLGVAGMVLLIACANVATLLLARTLRRRQEIGVRLALGISRTRLLAQTLADSFLLALLGAAAAMLTAHFLGGILQAWLLPDVAASGGFLSRRVVAIIILAIVIVGVLTGLAPALHARRVELAEVLKAGGRSASAPRTRLRAGLLVVQAALSVMLLIGAGLFVRSLGNAAGVRLGMDTSRLMLAEVSFPFGSLDLRGQDDFWRRGLERVQRLPGVERATLSQGTPFRFSRAGLFAAPGIDSIPQLATGGPYVNGVSPQYFATLGARILRGRGFEPTDVAGSQPVVVVNETMVRQLFPGRDPIGVCARIAVADSIPCATIVGVVEDVARHGIEQQPTMQYYVPLDQQRRCCSLAMIVRTRDDPDAMVGAVRRELQALSPDAPFPVVRPYADLVDPYLRSWRMGAMMFSLFGALAFGVSIVGLYGLLAYAVAQRRFEFGVRVALGARAGHIARIVMTEGSLAMLAGMVLGLIGAAVASRWTAPLLFHVDPRDAAVYGVVALIVVLASLAASVVPARRAAAVDPVIALRSD